jgi:hypothetical protein
MAQCDIFHLAKHALKHLAYSHDYHVSFLPLCSSGQMNHIDLTLNRELRPSSLLYLAPNINSFRRIKKLSSDDKKKWELVSHRENETRVRAAPDLNLYLAVKSLIDSQSDN